MLTKAFSPDAVGVDATSTLTFTLTNPNESVTLTGISFSDDLPTGVTVLNPFGHNDCGGKLSAVFGFPEIAVSGVTLPAGTSCTISVVVRVTTSGELLNTTSAVTADNVGAGEPASATLTVGPSYALPLVTAVGFSGDRLFFSLRSRASVAVRVDRRARGRRCATRRKARSSASCRLYRHVRTIRVKHAKRGRNRVKLPALRPGRYRVSVRAIARGTRGLAVRRSFTVH